MMLDGAATITHIAAENTAAALIVDMVKAIETISVELV